MSDVYSDSGGWNLLMSFHSPFLVFGFEIEGVVLRLYLNSRVWTHFLDGEVSCAATYLLLGGPVFMSVRRRRFGRLISFLRGSLSLGMFYIASYLLMLFCVPGTSFSLLTVDFVLMRRRICSTSVWSVILSGVCGMQCPLLLDIVSTWMGQI